MTDDRRLSALGFSPEQSELEHDAEAAAEMEARLDKQEQHIRQLERQAAEEERRVAVAIRRSLA